MPVPSRRERAIARIREEILEAAARAFAKRGYQSATMRDIAKEAGYTAASLYTYFRSKEEILSALATFIHEQFLLRFDEPMPQGLTFPQKMTLLVQRHIASVERFRDIYALLVTLAPPPACARGRKERASPFWHLDAQIARLAEWLSANATADDLGGLDPELVARFLVSLGHGFLWRWVSSGGEPLDRLADIILDLFFHGIGGRRATAGNGV